MAKLFDLNNQASRLKLYLKDIYADLKFLPLWVIALSVPPDFIMSNMQTFLTESVGFSVTTAAVIVNGHHGFVGVFAIVGAFVVDVYLTHYGMIFFSSLFYLCGLILLTCGCHFLNDEDMDVIISKWLVGAGLFLVAVGNFSLINSANAFFERADKKISPQNPIKYAMKFIVSVVLSPQNLIKYAMKFIVLVVSIVQDSWQTPKYDEDGNILHTPPQQFLFPAISMLLITLVSLCYLKNNSFIKPKKERWTLLNYVPRVYITAMMKYLPHCSNKDNESLIDNRFLEQSEITESSEPVLGQQPKTLCAITEVKGGKRLLHMVSMCLAFLAFGLVKSIGDTFFLDQASDMHGGDKVPVQAFIYLAAASSLLTIYLYKKMIFNRLPQPGKKYSPGIEYAMGMVLSALCCTTASWVAMSQFQLNEISVFWLTPQFVLFGAMDGLAEEGIEQFFSEQLPPSMKSYAHVFTQGIIGAGSVFGIILVIVTKAASNWLNEDNLRLDQFYHLLTVVGIVIFFGYTLVAVKYRYQDNEEENQVED